MFNIFKRKNKTEEEKVESAELVDNKKEVKSESKPKRASKQATSRTKKESDSTSTKATPAKKTAAKKTAKLKKEVKEKSPKELATEAGEPYINILSMDVDPENIHAGSFELDWNDKFIANLIRAGYEGKTDADLVDQWFQAVCRNVLLETWEQEQAIEGRRFTRSRDLGDGRTEIS